MVSSRFAKWNLVAVIALLLFLFFWIGPNGRPADWQRFIARLHPAVLHLPIGILLFAFVLAVAKSFRWLQNADGIVNVALLLGSWSGLVTIVAGLWLAQLGGYPTDLLFKHKLAGFTAVAVAAVLLLLRSSEFTNGRRPVEYGLWLLTMAALVFGGDLGGRMTHGPGFASEYAPGVARIVFGTPPTVAARFDLSKPAETTVFEGVVEPIFESKCVFCHGPDRAKGKLRLHTAEAITEHKGDEPLIVTGRPDESLLIKRISLPEGHEDQMPPALNAKPISHADVELIKWWVAEGASFDLLIADATIPPNVRTILDAYGLGEILTGIFALDVAMPDSIAVEALRATGALVHPLSIGSPYLTVRCAKDSDCFDGELLEPLSANVAWLDASESAVTDAQLSRLSDLKHLVRLDLSETDIDGSGLGAISTLEYLEYLNLYRTKVTDEALSTIEKLPSLKSLYLWQSRVTPNGAATFRQTKPSVDVNTGEVNG